MVWPRELLTPTRFSARLRNTSVSGGRGTAGAEQVITSPSGWWQFSLEDVIVQGASAVRAYRSILAGLDGRAGTILMPVWDGLQNPAGYPVEVPWDEEDILWDPDIPWESNVTNIVVDGDTAQGATSLNVTWTGTGPTSGIYFSARVGDLYTFHWISRLVSTGANTATLTIRPRLRIALPGATSLEFDDPRCLMRPATDDEGELMLQAPSQSRPSLTFVEATQATS
jgi:hypothetical protein